MGVKKNILPSDHTSSHTIVTKLFSNAILLNQPKNRGINIRYKDKVEVSDFSLLAPSAHHRYITAIQYVENTGSLHFDCGIGEGEQLSGLCNGN